MLINCVAYQEGKKLADIDVESISEYLSRPECFVWVALRDATDNELTQMQEEFGLHELALGVIASACSFVFWRFKRAGWL